MKIKEIGIPPNFDLLPTGSCELPNKHSNFIVKEAKEPCYQVFKVHIISNRISKYQVPSIRCS